MAIKFQTNIPQTLYFPYGDFMEVSGQYGAQFLYTVEAEGQRERLYATPRLHQDLQEAGVSPGDLVTITKVEIEGNRMAWEIKREGVAAPAENAPQATAPTNGAAHTTPPSQPQPPQNGAQRNGQPSSADTYTGVLLPTLARCMADVEQIAPESYGPEQRKSAALTLFLSCDKRGIVLAATNGAPSAPPQDEEPPMPTEAPPVPVGAGDEDLPF